MQLIASRQQLSDRLVEFCWDEWSQMGLMASSRHVSPWAADAEALIVFTLEVARDDPRLFDEVLDWTLLNERLLSIRRLRAMCTSTTDRALANAAIGWLGWQRPRARLKATVTSDHKQLVPLFRRGGPVPDADPSFAAAGLLRPMLLPSHKSRAPDFEQPINFGLRLRAILGVGLRAEIVRVMLGTDVPWMTSLALSRATGYAKRNVYEALVSLTDARVLASFAVGGEQRHTINKDIWAALLQLAPDRLPTHRDWPQLFTALRTILRWTDAVEEDSRSPYLVASGARQLLDELRPTLSFAGIPVQRVTVDDAAVELERITNLLISALSRDACTLGPSLDTAIPSWCA